MQLSPNLLKLATNKLKNYITETVIPNATKSIGKFVGNLHGQNSTYALQQLVPMCVNKMMYELENGVCGVPNLPPNLSSKSTSNVYGFAAMSDATFHWYQCILVNIVSQCGGTVLLEDGLRR